MRSMIQESLKEMRKLGGRLMEIEQDLGTVLIFFLNNK
jgi:hypothetical protein